MEIVEGQTTFAGHVTKADGRFDAHIADLKTRETKKKGKQRS